MGKSQLLLNLISYVIAEDPGPALVVQPTLPMAEAFSKDRLSPLFRDTPVLQGLVATAKARDIGSTILHRRFRDGHVSIVGANSPAGLASRPIRYLLMDGSTAGRIRPARKATALHWRLRARAHL